MLHSKLTSHSTDSKSIIVTTLIWSAFRGHREPRDSGPVAQVLSAATAPRPRGEGTIARGTLTPRGLAGDGTLDEPRIGDLDVRRAGGYPNFN
jgi:hypothetical protein